MRDHNLKEYDINHIKKEVIDPKIYLKGIIIDATRRSVEQLLRF